LWIYSARLCKVKVAQCQGITHVGRLYITQPQDTVINRTL
jgi:hypothetical protein